MYLTPIDFGLTYSFHAFSVGNSEREGSYAGELAVFISESARTGITAEYWSAFTQNYAPAFTKVLRGEISALEGYIR